MILYIIIPKVKMYSVFVRIVVVGVTLKSCSFVMIVDEPHYYDCDYCDYYDCDCDYDSVWSSLSFFSAAQNDQQYNCKL